MLKFIWACLTHKPYAWIIMRKDGTFKSVLSPVAKRLFR